MQHKHMRERCKEMLSVKKPVWILDPFLNVDGTETILQEKLTNPELKLRLKSDYCHFWLQRQIAGLYPRLWNAIKVLFSFSHLIWLNVDSLPEQIFGKEKKPAKNSPSRRF
ncbi:LOW QUALITY PROTEIN: hypothetical protein M514_23128 [Trichuris suis]|uniref:Uncharacterized protein n=1 Tax=Trichuris suis TaxID=68888 RepID=A0A085N5C4_9BILA|nr:LOW QUALITY PROTEIN: hypothetical protein M514_23128 [Trichuris suis]